MVEMRFLVPAGTNVPGPIPRLQYRTLLARNSMSQPIWSAWFDVPVVVEPEPMIRFAQPGEAQ